MTLFDMLFYLSVMIVAGGILCLILVLTGILDRWADAQRERVEALRWEMAKARGDRREMWRMAMRDGRR